MLSQDTHVICTKGIIICNDTYSAKDGGLQRYCQETHVINTYTTIILPRAGTKSRTRDFGTNQRLNYYMSTMTHHDGTVIMHLRALIEKSLD